MKLKYKLIFFFIGLAGIAVLLWQANLPSVDWSLVFSKDSVYLLLVLISLWIVIYVLHIISYKIILEDEAKKIGFLKLGKIVASGFALNAVTPAGLIGGEPYRIMELKRYCSTEKSTSSTLSFSMLYMVGHFALIITASIIYCFYGLPGSLPVDILMILAGIVLTVLFVGFILLRKRGFVYPIMRFLARLPFLKRFLEKPLLENRDSYIEIDNSIKEFRNSKSRFTIVMLLQYLTRLLEAFEYFLLYYFFVRNTGESIHFFDGILIMGVASLIGNIVFVIPMQTATREGGMTIALGFLLKSSEVIETTAVGIGLLYRIREFIFILFGISIVLFGKIEKKVTPKIEEIKAKINKKKE